jgi:hypothetical protein
MSREKMSVGQNIQRDKISLGQNVLTDKMPSGTKHPQDKMSSGQNSVGTTCLPVIYKKRDLNIIIIQIKQTEKNPPNKCFAAPACRKIRDYCSVYRIPPIMSEPDPNLLSPAHFVPSLKGTNLLQNLLQHENEVAFMYLFSRTAW